MNERGQAARGLLQRFYELQRSVGNLAGRTRPTMFGQPTSRNRLSAVLIRVAPLDML